MRPPCYAITFALLGALATAATRPLAAQPVRTAQVSPSSGSRISADSNPYHIEWNGASGVFVRKAINGEPESRQPLAFLHTDAGPTGYARHLAWFLARDDHSFSLLWCYLNDSGAEFDCWLYRYPSNQLTSNHFTGQYQYGAPTEPVPASPHADFKLTALPTYSGPPFTFRDWTKRVGSLPRLDLNVTRQAASGAAAPAAPGAPAKTLTQLRVQPLHLVEVGAANGWREGGWKELHAIAFDSEEDPYYLILYSNTSNGYAVDLKRSQIYTTDFGSKVVFPDAGQFGPKDNPLNIDPEIKVRRYDRHEIVLKTAENPANPYRDIQVGVEFRGPDARPILVPGFWDGGGTFRVRFAPTLRGRWTWKSLSQTADLNNLSGDFECIGEDAAVKGFVTIQANHKDSRHFAYTNGDPFLPVPIREPLPAFATMSRQSGSAATSRAGIQLAGLAAAAPQDDTAAFIAFQRFVDAAAQRGINRFLGGSLLGPAATKLVRSNEGGAAFDGIDLDKINPLFFQAMDRRIAYCNARGIVPDIGLGTLDDSLLTTYRSDALFRFWAYVVARYSAFDIQWSLFEPGEGALSDATKKSAEQFAELTRLYDPNHHPLTSAVVGLTTAPAPAAAPERRPTPPAPGSRPGRPVPGTPPAANDKVLESGGALSSSRSSGPKPVYGDQSWEDVITILGGDVNALPYYTLVKKPLVLVERATVDKAGALNPDVARHRMWEARMKGAYYAPGIVPKMDPTELNAPELQWAVYCGDIFRKTRFYRLDPRQEMLGGPTESPADRRRRKRAEAEAAKKNPPPVEDNPVDFDPFDPDPFANLPPLPAPKPVLPTFVLADPAREYLVYFEQGGSLLLDLLEATGKVQVTWFNPRTGAASPTKQITGGAYTPFTAPDANDWVLYVSRL